MLQHKKYIAKIIIFCIVAGMVVFIVNKVLNPKYLQDSDWPTTQTYLDFYEVERDTIDVLFLGSSHAVSGFSPLELYKNYKIESYNLGCEQQNIFTSYYWLKEALRYQQPKVVVLDTYILFDYATWEPLNSEEANTRKVVDYMKWSPVKMEMVWNMCQIDKEQDLMSFYFTNIRFHSRWTDLKEDDFIIDKNKKGLMGFTALKRNECVENYVPFVPNEAFGEDVPDEVMGVYLDKIVSLCNENDIELILCKTPTTKVNIPKYNYLTRYAKENYIQYLDFNEYSLYEDIGYNFVEDNCEAEHANYKGAIKLTNYIGKVLSESYGFVGEENKQYEEWLTYYNAAIKDCGLSEITDMNEYLDAINDPRYAVFIANQGTEITALTPELIQKLQKLGAKIEFSNLNGASYLFIKDGERVIFEEEDNELIDTLGTIRNGLVTYRATSAGIGVENISLITIDNTEYSKWLNGMNIVVYSLEDKCVIDAVCFDTDITLTALR